MCWKRSTTKRLDGASLSLLTALVMLLFALPIHGQTNAPASQVPALKVVPAVVSARKIKAIDADNHNILLNRPGVISLVLGTGENSQEAARAAGKMMYPLQGRPDFQLAVVVDLRDSIATWVPSVVTSKMRANLDDEALELKPYFLKNGNKGNPRYSTYVIPDFSGTICPQLGWKESSDDLRGILFGTDGRELKRWDKIDDMAKLQSDVRAAIHALINSEQARENDVNKNQGTKIIQTPTAHPPLLPEAPVEAN